MPIKKKGTKKAQLPTLLTKINTVNHLLCSFLPDIYSCMCIYIHKLSKNTVNSPAECHPTEQQGSSTQEVAC